MTDPSSGLPADILNSDGSTSVQTSTTNIGAYMWSAVSAQRLGFITRRELVARLSRTIGTLERMERYADTGQFYNWYDHRTGAKLTAWPPNPDDTSFHPILSSVDNGWLAVGLKVVAATVPRLARRARDIYEAMDFGFYYVPDVNRVLFHFRPDDPAASPCCYDTLVSESRIVDYIGIGSGQLPQKIYYGRWRTFPDTCEYSFQETKPVGEWRRYSRERLRGRLRLPRHTARSVVGRIDVRGPHAGPVRAEERWARRSWGENHPLTVRAQVFHGMEEAGYGYWGFSPANKPEGDYGAWGVDGAGMDPNGMPSNEDATLVDHGFPGCPGCRPATRSPTRRESAYTNGVVPARRLPCAALRAPRDAGEPAQAHGGLPRPLREVGLSRQRERADQARLRRLPVARPGNDHSRARKRARRRRPATGFRGPRPGTQAAPGHRDRALRRRALSSVRAAPPGPPPVRARSAPAPSARGVDPRGRRTAT